MNLGEFKLTVGNWNYVLKQDYVTGGLEVLSVTPKTLVEKVKDYVKAEVSAVVKTVELPVLDQRKDACESCESRKLVGPDEWYCKSCGCPQWERSKLQVKWELPAATCPLGKWTG
jgi:hypothetical protein